MKKFIVFEYTLKNEPVYENGALIGYDEVITLCGLASNEEDFQRQLDPEYMYDVKVIGDMPESAIRSAAGLTLLIHK